MGAFCCHGNQSFDPICPKTLCSLSPTPVMLHIKFDQDWPTHFRDTQVWKCGRRRTDDDGPLVYYKLTLWAFGSGELKKTYITGKHILKMGCLLLIQLLKNGYSISEDSGKTLFQGQNEWNEPFIWQFCLRTYLLWSKKFKPIKDGTHKTWDYELHDIYLFILIHDECHG